MRKVDAYNLLFTSILCLSANAGDFQTALNLSQRICGELSVSIAADRDEKDDAAWRVVQLHVTEQFRKPLMDSDLKKIAQLSTLQRLRISDAGRSTDDGWRE